jgi:hypothetical protein
LLQRNDDAVPSERTSLVTVRIAPMTRARQVRPIISPAVTPFVDMLNGRPASSNLFPDVVHSQAKTQIVNVKRSALVSFASKHFNAAIAASPVLRFEHLEAEFLRYRFDPHG